MLSTAFMTETQDRTPRDWMALVTTLLQSIRQISPGLGILLGGVLAAAGSSRLAFAVAGGGCLLFAAATFVLMSPKRLERRRAVGPRSRRRPTTPGRRPRPGAGARASARRTSSRGADCRASEMTIAG